MVWARTSYEEELVSTSLNVLAEVGSRLVIADAGSGEGFVTWFEALPNVTVVRGARGLVPQTRGSLHAARF